MKNVTDLPAFNFHSVTIEWNTGNLNLMYQLALLELCDLPLK